jgi:hypothetical protein
VHRQVGCRGYAIDLAVADTAEPGRYILGIECDGAMYHRSATARDRDRLRQQVLEDLGWRIFRVWSTDWYRKPGQELERLLDAIERAKLGQYPARFVPRKTETPSSPEGHQVYIVSDSGTIRPSAQVPGPVYSPSSDAESGDLPPFAEEYRCFTPAETLARDDFYSVPVATLAELVAEVVEVEGPIHEEELVRRIAAAYGLGRAGLQVQGRVHVAVEKSAEDQGIERRDEFVWPFGMTVPPVRHRSGDGKDIALVSLEEIGEAAWHLLKAQFDMSHEDLVAQVGRLLGFQRTGRLVEARVREAINREVRDGRIVTGMDGRLESLDR